MYIFLSHGNVLRINGRDS